MQTPNTPSHRAAGLPKITDPEGARLFRSITERIIDSQSARAVFSEADKKRLGNTADQHEAAHMYLALAFRLIDTPALHKKSPSKMFHFAGHLFREIGQLNRAADAYRRAGVMSDPDETPLGFGIRSLARAKSCYAEIGETALSDEMHRLEWEARRLRSGGAAPFLIAWKVTSDYGTSATRWMWSVLAFLAAFTVWYEWLHSNKALCDTQPWTPYLTAVYYAIVTTATVGYGEIVPCRWSAQVAVILNIACAYVLLAIGATVLGRKVLGR